VPPGRQRFPGPCGTYPTAVGNKWIEFDTSCYHCRDVVRFENVATGQVMTAPTNPTLVVDLNSAHLAQPICRPLAAAHPQIVQLLGRYVIVRDGQGYAVGRCGDALQRPIDPRRWPLADEAGLLLWGAPSGGQLDGLTLPAFGAATIHLPEQLDFVNAIALSGPYLYVENSTGQIWSTRLPEEMLPRDRSRPPTSPSVGILRSSSVR
jgi:hypothetical protein